jgi:hypothetical protein
MVTDILTARALKPLNEILFLIEKNIIVNKKILLLKGSKILEEIEEAEKFWPVFNTFDTKQFELRSKKKQLMLRLKPENSGSISDKEMVISLNESEDLDNQIQQNRRIFIKNLQGIMSAQKILILKKSEDDFKNEILKQIKNRKQNRE